MATKRFVSKDNLGRVWTRLFGKVLNSKEEIEANKSENMIAGADAVKEVYSSFGGLKFYEDENGNKYVVGADSVPKKLGECDFKIKIRAAYGGTSDDGLYDKEFTYKNGTWTSKDIQKDNGRGTIQGWLYVSVLSFEML